MFGILRFFLSQGGSNTEGGIGICDSWDGVYMDCSVDLGVDWNPVPSELDASSLSQDPPFKDLKDDPGETGASKMGFTSGGFNMDQAIEELQGDSSVLAELFQDSPMGQFEKMFNTMKDDYWPEEEGAVVLTFVGLQGVGYSQF